MIVQLCHAFFEFGERGIFEDAEECGAIVDAELHFSAAGIVSTSAEHLKFDGFDVGEGSVEVVAMGAGGFLPVQLGDECVGFFVSALSVDFHLAEVSVGSSITTGDVVHIVNALCIVKVIDEHDGIAFGESEVRIPGAVPEGGGVSVVTHGERLRGLGCVGRTSGGSDEVILRKFVEAFISGLCDDQRFCDSLFLVGESHAAFSFCGQGVCLEVHIDRSFSSLFH